MMKRRLPKKTKVHNTGQSEFQTLAITDSTNQEPVTHVPLPSEMDIKEAKDWVDSNEK